MSLRQPISISKGRSVAITVTITDEAGNAYSPTDGDIVRFGVKRDPDDDRYLIVRTVPSSEFIISTSPACCQVKIYVRSSDTSQLLSGDYWYDIGLQRSDSEWDQGYFDVVPCSPFRIAPSVTLYGEST